MPFVGRKHKTDSSRHDSLTRYEEQTAAILDTKWSLTSLSSGSGIKGLLGVADASGHVSFHSLEHESADSSWRLPRLAKLPFNDHKALCLSLDWSDRISHYPPSAAAAAQVQDASLVVSQSDGSLAWLPSVAAAVSADEATLKRSMVTRFPREAKDDDEEESEDEEEDEAVAKPPLDWPEKPIGLETWHAHDHEAWIAAFDAHSDGRIIWSGELERVLAWKSASNPILFLLPTNNLHTPRRRRPCYERLGCTHSHCSSTTLADLYEPSRISRRCDDDAKSLGEGGSLGCG